MRDLYCWVGWCSTFFKGACQPVGTAFNRAVNSPAWTLLPPLCCQAYKISPITNNSHMKSCEMWNVWNLLRMKYVSKCKKRKACITFFFFFFFCLSHFFSQTAHWRVQNTHLLVSHTKQFSKVDGPVLRFIGLGRRGIKTWHFLRFSFGITLRIDLAP